MRQLHGRGGPAIRITSLDQIEGNEVARRYLRGEVSAAVKAHRPMRHALLTGPGGLGKNAMAEGIAAELKAPLRLLSAEGLTQSRVVSLLLALPTAGYSKTGVAGQGAGQIVLFLDEAHMAPSFEGWYSAMQDFEVPVRGGVSWLPFFTLIAATTEPHLLPPSFTRRFGITLELNYYSEAELSRIILRHYPGYDKRMATAVAARSRGEARLALSYAQSALTHGANFFEDFGITEEGLTPLDMRYLDLLYQSSAPLSAASIAARLGRPAKVIEGTVEPFLHRLGYIEITGRGRVLAPGRCRGRREESALVRSLL